MSKTVMKQKRLRVLACSLCVILSLTGMSLFLAPMKSYDFRIASYPYIGEFSWLIDWPSNIGDAMLGTTPDIIEMQVSTAESQQCQGTETDEIQFEYTLIPARPRQENRCQDPIIDAPAVEIERHTVTVPEYDHQPAYYQRTVDLQTPIPLQELPLLEPHDPIYIDGDLEFMTLARRERWLGSGTEEDPYLIQSLDIDVGGDDRSCIEIRNIAETYFRIQFCTLQGAAPDWRAGIHLYNVNYGKLVSTTLLSNNTCIGNCYGIRIDNAYSIVVANNTCSSNSWEGIGVLYESRQNMVTNNFCYDNGWSGIGVGIGASENIIAHNYCFNNPQAGVNLWLGINNVLRDNDCRENRQWGIAVRGESTGNQVLENLCNTNMMGIFVNASSNNELDSNTCEENNYGIALYYSNLNTLANNNCSKNDWEGIAVIYESRQNVVRDNECFDNGWSGIGVGVGASENIIVHNHCFINPQAGINLWLGIDNTLQDNNCSENTLWGIAVRGESTGNQVLKNLCRSNMNGIIVSDSGDNTLSGNTCTDNYMYGICLDESNENTLNENACTDNYYAIYLDESDGNTLSGNTCSDNDYSGIRLEYSVSNILIDNICNGNGHPYVGDGIRLSFSSEVTLNSNTCNNNMDCGIHLLQSNGCILADNTCKDTVFANGIRLDESDGCTLTNNTCSDNNEVGIYLSQVESNTLFNCICEYNGLYGIRLWFSTGCILNDNTCNANDDGIYLGNSDGNTLDGNDCTDNYEGIHVLESGSNTLVDNICSGLREAIYLDDSDGNMLYGNICNYGLRGIQLLTSDDNELVGNHCSGNTLQGISIGGSHRNFLSGNTCNGNKDGITIYDNSNGNRVQENTCNGNADAGISIRYSDDNRVYYDICIENEFGLHITSSYYIVVWWNTFAESSEHDVQENVVGTLNDFYYNYYSEYSGPDNDGDGIGDTPYTIPGMAGSIDPYPLVYYPKSRWVALPTDLTLEFSQRLALLNLDLDLEAGPYDPPVESWWISDKEHFAINNEGRITDLMQLPIGTYVVEVQVENIYSVYADEWLAPYGIRVGILTAIFTITVVDSLSVQWSLELNGNFDYPDTEEVPIQIGALLTFAETGESVSGAYIELRIYDPDGNLFWTVTMSEIEPGVYLYRSPETIAYYVAEGIWQKGIYLVVGEASSDEGYPVHARSMIQYHIDPPSASGADTLALFTLAGFGAVILLHSVFAGQYIWRKRRFNHRISEG
ncbi:MAG: nitrous oxide reductase family maturation protein NosD [Candidatus Thorarchaeota archaeon]